MGSRTNHSVSTQQMSRINSSNSGQLTSPASAGTSRRSEYDHITETMKRPLELHEQEDVEEYFDTDEDSSDAGDIESRYVNLALLSHIAVKLRDKVPRATHVKGSIPYPHAFTGKEIVSTIQSQIQRELLTTMNISTNDRTIALAIARSLQSQLFFYEVEWSGKAVSDGVEDVFMFLDDQDATNLPERSELPTGVITFLTKCYVSSCLDETPCYSYACPKRKSVSDYYYFSLTITYSIATDTSTSRCICSCSGTCCSEREGLRLEQWYQSVNP
jgi:hypothetical protein